MLLVRAVTVGHLGGQTCDDDSQKENDERKQASTSATSVVLALTHRSLTSPFARALRGRRQP